MINKSRYTHSTKQISHALLTTDIHYHSNGKDRKKKKSLPKKNSSRIIHSDNLCTTK